MSQKTHLSEDTATYYAKYYRQAVATVGASVFAVPSGSPFENIKTRMQSYNFTSALACANYTYRNEGARGFFAGTTAPLAGLLLTRVLNFGVYRKAKYYLDGVIENATGSSPLQHVNRPGTYPNAATIVCFTGAGAIAGIPIALVMTPFELVKNCSQTSVLMAKISTNVPDELKNAKRISQYQAAKTIVKSRGVLGLYTGFNLHLAREVAGSAIYFGVYETVKQSINSAYGMQHVNAPGAVAAAGMICGVVSGTATYTLDAMKTQAQNRLVGAGAKDYASAALSAVGQSKASKWKGLEMMIARSAIQNMIQMSLFEQFKSYIDELTFSDGSTTLPEVERELGRDQRIKRNDKL